MNYIKKIKNINNDKEGFYISLLPILNMAYKLILRKNNGKKPFSKEFDASDVINKIEEVSNQINNLNGDNKININRDILEEISNKLILATKEIKSESLANDFVYLSKQISEVLKII